MLESIKKVDKKILTMAGIVFGIIIIFIIAIVVVSLTSGGKISFSKIESKLEKAAESYYKDNDSALPKEIGKTEEIDDATLVSGGYIKDLSEYTDENVSCSAKVIVGKTMDGYDYVANLDCGDEYKTEFLADKLIESDLVTTGNGLYKMEDVVEVGETLGIDDSGYDLSTNELMKGYIYRGENVNNYVKVGDQLFRILKIDGNKDFTLVIAKSKVRGSYDDRYNTDIAKEDGINNYTTSRAYEALTDNYKNADELVKSKLASKNICIGARSVDETSTDGSVECSVVMKNQYYSLIPIFDIMNTSLSEGCETSISRECSNYNFLIDGNSSWSMTPSTDNTYTAYRITESISVSRTSMSGRYKYVYYLSNRLVFDGGTGTENDPYIVK